MLIASNQLAYAIRETFNVYDVVTLKYLTVGIVSNLVLSQSAVINYAERPEIAEDYVLEVASNLSSENGTYSILRDIHFYVEVDDDFVLIDYLEHMNVPFNLSGSETGDVPLEWFLLSVNGEFDGDDLLTSAEHIAHYFFSEKNLDNYENRDIVFSLILGIVASLVYKGILVLSVEGRHLSVTELFEQWLNSDTYDNNWHTLDTIFVNLTEGGANLYHTLMREDKIPVSSQSYDSHVAFLSEFVKK
jgi:hypothetical protein